MRIWLSSLAICMCLGVLLHNQPASADSVQITMSPISDTLELAPNKQYQKSITIYNSGTEPYQFVIYATPYTVADENYRPVFDTDTPRTQLDHWIQLPRTIYSLQPKQQITVPYTIKTPSSLPDGGQYAAIFAETAGEQSTDNLLTKKRVGMILYTHANGKTINQGSTTISVPPLFTTSAQYNMVSRVTNSGNVDFEVISSLDVTDTRSGKRVYHTSSRKPVLPDTTRRVTLPWQGNSPGLFAVYTIAQREAYLGKTDSSIRTVVILSPFLLFAIVCLVLTIAILVAWRLHVLYRRRRTRRQR